MKETTLTKKPATQDATEDGLEDVAALREQRCREEYERVRLRMFSTLASALEPEKSLLIERDLHDYMKGAEEEQMEAAGYKKSEEQLKALLELEGYAQTFVSEAREFGQQYFAAINTAEKEGSLSHQSAEKLRAKAKERSTDWTSVKEFFRKDDKDPKAFAHWVKNWGSLKEQLSQVQQWQKRLKLRPDAHPALAFLQSEKFKNGQYKDRLVAVNKALEALTEIEHGQKDAYRSARGKLEDAVREGGLAAHKVGPWLAHIFTKFQGKKAEEFIERTLPTFIGDWVAVRKKFDAVAPECRLEGISVISDAAFLDLSYDERVHEVTKLEKLQKGEISQNPMLRRIQDQIDAEDWDGAEQAIDQAELTKLSAKDRTILFGLRRYLEANRPDEEEETTDKESMVTVQEKYFAAEDAMWAAISKHAPASVKMLYNRCLHEPGQKAIRCAMTGIYNMIWARNHYYLDTDRLDTLRDRSEADTQRVQQFGHIQKGMENISFKAKTEGPHNRLRKFEGGVSKGATYYHFDRQTLDPLMTDIRSRGDVFVHNYWVLFDPEDATIPQLEHMVYDIHPLIKKFLSARTEYESNVPTHLRVSRN